MRRSLDVVVVGLFTVVLAGVSASDAAQVPRTTPPNESLPSLVDQRGVCSLRDDFDVVPFLRSPVAAPTARDLTLAVHVSVDRLPALKRWCRSWQGPMSVSVCETPVKFSQFSRRDHRLPSHAGSTSVLPHIARGASIDLFLQSWDEDVCLSTWASLHAVLLSADEISAVASSPNVDDDDGRHELLLSFNLMWHYPFNTMRNAAIAGVTHTPYYLLVDADLHLWRLSQDARVEEFTTIRGSPPATILRDDDHHHVVAAAQSPRSPTTTTSSSSQGLTALHRPFADHFYRRHQLWIPPTPHRPSTAASSPRWSTTGSSSQTYWILPVVETVAPMGVAAIPVDASRFHEALQGPPRGGLGSVRPFYSRTCPTCYGVENLTHWLLLSPRGDDDHKGGTTVLDPYEVPYASHYEPFTVLPRGCPVVFDESFVGRDFDKTSFIWQLNAAGWKGRVVAPPFFLVNSGVGDEPSDAEKRRPHSRWRIRAHEIAFDRLKRNFAKEEKFRISEGRHRIANVSSSSTPEDRVAAAASHTDGYDSFTQGIVDAMRALPWDDIAAVKEEEASRFDEVCVSKAHFGLSHDPVPAAAVAHLMSAVCSQGHLADSTAAFSDPSARAVRHRIDCAPLLPGGIRSLPATPTTWRYDWLLSRWHPVAMKAFGWGKRQACRQVLPRTRRSVNSRATMMEDASGERRRGEEEGQLVACDRRCLLQVVAVSASVADQHPSQRREEVADRRRMWLAALNWLCALDDADMLPFAPLGNCSAIHELAVGFLHRQYGRHHRFATVLGASWEDIIGGQRHGDVVTLQRLGATLSLLLTWHAQQQQCTAAAAGASGGGPPGGPQRGGGHLMVTVPCR
mgnify:FL=1